MADSQRYFFLNMIAAGVNGGSPKASHINWLELDNWDFSMNQTADPNVKGGRPSKTSATGRFGFSIVHNGPTLFKLAASGQYINTPIVFEAERSRRWRTSRSCCQATSTQMTTLQRACFTHLISRR